MLETTELNKPLYIHLSDLTACIIQNNAFSNNNYTAMGLHKVCQFLTALSFCVDHTQHLDSQFCTNG